MIIGIDLGTTFSVVAIKGRVELTEGYPEANYLEQYDVSLIPDPYGSFLIPSAIWEDPENPGVLVVGADAKNAADQGYSPAMFFKRDIGTDILRTVGDRQLTAAEASREVLAYLKSIAEQALGRVVDSAVITHPAYFDPAMIEETGEAARAAGFAFDSEIHLLQEPTAAALTYLRADDRDPLRILTYDLGGGTFDVTLLERRSGVPMVKNYGGNRLLGGYNFDRLLAEWLLGRMRDRGVQIALDESNPLDRAKWAKLLHLAEDVKIRLAGARTDAFPVPIKETLFPDDNGHVITLTDRITRQQFTDLIQPLLDETTHGQGGEGETKGCLKTLQEVGWTIDDLHEVILVGGSCAAPWVVETVTRDLGKPPLCDCEPDFCVAVGAALKAAAIADHGLAPGGDRRLELSYPAQSTSEMIVVGGCVLPVEGQPLPVGLQAHLASAGVRPAEAKVSEDGRFTFRDVDVQPESTTRFTLTVADGEGRTFAEQEFDVRHTYDADDLLPPVLTVLPKPLYIEVAGGLKPLAEEGRSLPAHCEETFVRTNNLPDIEIRLFQESEQIGTVVIPDVPSEAGLGCKVVLSADVSGNNRITGRATVHTRSGSVVREAPVDVRIPRMKIPELDALRVEFRVLQSDLEERLDLEKDSTTRAAMRADGDLLADKIRALLDAPFSDRQEIWLALRQLSRTAKPVRVALDPSREVFDKLVVAVRGILHERAQDPTAQAYVPIVDKAAQDGQVAYDRRDQKAWGQGFRILRDTYEKLKPAPEPGPSTPPPPTPVLKRYARNDLDEVRQEMNSARAELERKNMHGRMDDLGRLGDDLAELEGQIDRLDDQTEPATALGKMQEILQKAQAIRASARSIAVDIRPG